MNPFDQFDAPPAQPPQGGPPAQAANPFDQFDAAGAPNGNGAPPVTVTPGTPGQQPEAPAGPGMLSTAGSYVDNLVRQAADTAFPFANRLAAAGDAALEPVLGRGSDAPRFSDRYAANLAAENAHDQQFSSAHPVAATAANLAGGTAGTLALLPEAVGGAATTLAGRVAQGAGLGAATGAVSGAASSPDMTKVGQTALRGGEGALVGAGLGGIVAGAGSGIGSLYRNLKTTAVPPVMGPNGPLTTEAQQIAGDALHADGVAHVQQQAAALGPQGMPADYGNNLLGVAQGLAIKPGAAGQQVVQALQNRNAGTNARLGQAIGDNFGPVVSPAEHAAEIDGAAQPLAAAQQAALARSGPLDPSAIQQRIGEALPNVAPGSPEANALLQARGMLSAPDGSAVPPRQVYSARQALDDLIDWQPGGPPPSSAVRSQQGALQGVRGDVNDLLRTVPGYGDATDGLSLLNQRRNAYATGQGDLTRDAAHYPPDFEQDFNTLPRGLLANPVPDALGTIQGDRQAGVRFAVEQALGTKENDLQALRNLTQGPNGWNATNLGTVFGQDAADRVNGALASEMKMRDTYNQVAQNSATAKRQAMAKMLADEEWEPKELPEVHDLTTHGMVLGIPRWLGNKAYQAMQTPVDNVARDNGLADFITSQGPTRQQMMVDLLAAHGARAANAAVDPSAIYRGAAVGSAVAPSMLVSALLAHRRDEQ